MSKKYTYKVFWSEQDNAYLAECADFKGMMTGLMTHGDTALAALGEMISLINGCEVLFPGDGDKVPAPVSQRPE